MWGVGKFLRIFREYVRIHVADLLKSTKILKSDNSVKLILLKFSKPYRNFQIGKLLLILKLFMNTNLDCDDKIAQGMERKEIIRIVMLSLVPSTCSWCIDLAMMPIQSKKS